jgi:hypothetical protein
VWEVTGPEKDVRLVYREALGHIIAYRFMDDMAAKGGKPGNWVPRNKRWQD